MSLQKIKERIFTRTKTKKIIFFFIGDIIFIALSYWFAFLLRFEWIIPIIYWPMIIWTILLSLPIIIFFFILGHLYDISWSFISIRELLKLLGSTIVSFFVIACLIYILKISPVFVGFPRSVFFITAVLFFFFAGLLRFAKRIYRHLFQERIFHQNQGKKVLIIGAGSAGERLIRRLDSLRQSPYLIIGFVDDNRMKQAVSIHGIKVLGTRDDIPEIVKKYDIEELIFTIPSASQTIIRETIGLARQSGIQKIKILPGTKDILDEKISLTHLRDISIEDLLGREKVEIDSPAIQDFITNKTILVTGAAGSIGSYLCAQILKFKPKKLIAFDQNETAIFWLKRKLHNQFPNIAQQFEIGDIGDQKKIDWLFDQEKPQIVFHAAAYKHVPLMEDHPEEAIRNNIFGTLTIGQAAIKYNSEKFVFISTDKAIKPTSVMGATKRIGEMICVWLNQQKKTSFCAVRFGNVLGSRGSVVPIFEEQIKKGGPIEITHPEMKRYFMITSEACLLVMQAGALSQGGEVFVLDMGKSIKIVDLAKEMIRLSGYLPDIDIPIIFTHARPGEKLFEELVTNEEEPTKHEKIYIAKLSNSDTQKMTDYLAHLKKAGQTVNKKEIINILKKLVPTYSS